jgi:serine/threonine-protein kinase
MPSDTDDRTVKTAAPFGDALIGRTLGGRYKVESLLGAGGVGAVYKGQHLVLGTPVAIKVLLAQHMNDPLVVQRFLREARAASMLHHPNALIVHDFGQEDGVAYMVMELLNGQSLDHLLGRRKPLLSVARVARILAQVSDALAAAHALGIVHRDIKPANIVLEDRLNEQDFVKVVDFGLARIVGTPGNLAPLEEITMHQGSILGTPLYMAPEQCMGTAISPATDVYALGEMLYEMLTGRAPFTGRELLAVLAAHVHQPTPAVVRPDGAEAVPPEWLKLIADSLEKAPEMRPPNAQEFRNRLLGVYQTPSKPPPGATAGREAPYAPPAATGATAKPFEGRVAVWGGAFGARTLLEAEEITADRATSLAEVMALPATVVLLDLGRDAGPAIEALKALKGRAGAPPVLVVTSDTQVETGRSLLAAGADGVLVPPLAGAELVRQVKRVARRRR